MFHRRRITSLDGVWDLEVLGKGVTARVEVPAPWTVQVPGFEESHDTVRYSRSFNWQQSEPHGTVWLRFDGVNHSAVVTLNGMRIGSHEGAWTAFEFRIDEWLVQGENRLEVAVSYPPLLRSGSSHSFLEVPHGKQTWYGTGAGLWQSVTIEERASTHILQWSAAPDAATNTIAVDAKATDPGARLLARAVFDGVDVASAELVDGRCVLEVSDARRWDLHTPNLYDVVVEVHDDGAVMDAVQTSTGFRTFEARDGRFWLNGREIEMRGVLDQDYHPGGSTLPSSTQELEDLFRAARDLGFNTLRVHIKRPDPRYYEIADRLGMLVWTELPNWLTWTPEGAAQGADLLERFVREDSHHPSIVVWSVMNESWGIDLKSAKQRRWLQETFTRIKKVALGSLVVDNSACRPNFHIESDIDDYHFYRGIPESRREWDELISEFATRPDWTYSPYGDARRTGSEPLVLSEYGNWGLPNVLDQYVAGEEPWWFATGADWAFGAGEGTGLMRRFHSLGLADVFGSWDNLVGALHKSQLVANRYQTTSIRMRPELSGYVITELSDVLWEANGLFDMNRVPKQGTAEFGLVNGECAVALRPAVYSVESGETLALQVAVIPARGVDHEMKAELRVLVDGTEHSTWDVDAARREQFDVEVLLSGQSRQVDISAELLVDGHLAARDRADVLLVDAGVTRPHRVSSVDPEVREWLKDLGYEALTEFTEGALAVTRVFDDRAQEFAREGGRVLVLVEDGGALADAFDYLPSAKLGGRSGDGDWVPRTEWLDRRGAFREVPGDTILGIAFEDLLGPWVINGIPHPMRSARVHSAIFSGWLRGAATTTASVAWSEGAVTLTTLRVREALSVAPIASAVGHGLIRAAMGD